MSENSHHQVNEMARALFFHRFIVVFFHKVSVCLLNELSSAVTSCLCPASWCHHARTLRICSEGKNWMHLLEYKQ